MLGIIGLVLCSFAAPFAWMQGRQAEQAIAGSPGSYGGKGMATAGKILGMIGTAILVIVIIVVIIAVAGGLASDS